MVDRPTQDTCHTLKRVASMEMKADAASLWDAVDIQGVDMATREAVHVVRREGLVLAGLGLADRVVL